MAIEPNAALVKVFDTEQESEAMVVQGLLESAGIESVMLSLEHLRKCFLESAEWFCKSVPTSLTKP